MTLTLMDATADDAAAWHGLWQGFLDFYGVALDPAVTAHTWARILDPDHRMSCRIACDGEDALGFAIHHHHCSTWVMGDDVYLEDLFVAPAARGRGVGRALIEDLMELGRKHGWHRLYWNTDHENAAARRLYDSFDTTDGHVRYRLIL